MRSTFPPLPRPYLITVAEAARRLAVKPFAVAELIRTGQLPAGRIGRQYVLDPSDVRDYAKTVLESGA